MTDRRGFFGKLTAAVLGLFGVGKVVAAPLLADDVYKFITTIENHKPPDWFMLDILYPTLEIVPGMMVKSAVSTISADGRLSKGSIRLTGFPDDATQEMVDAWRKRCLRPITMKYHDIQLRAVPTCLTVDAATSDVYYAYEVRLL